MTTIAAAPSASAPRSRRLWLAGLLSLCCIGLGQLYNGNPRKALCFWAFWLMSNAAAVVLMNVAAPSPPSFEVALVLAALTVGVQLYGVVDAVREGRRLPATSLKRYQRFWVYVLGVISVAAVANGGFALAGWRSFTMEATSMLPTLAPGDRFLVERYSREKPHRGDLAIFHPASYPEQHWVKRIIGLPGDRVQLRDGLVYLNGVPLPHAALTPTRAGDLYAETAPDGRGYRVLESDRDRYRDTVEWTLAADQYFVLGDNRRYSIDSRDPRVGLVSGDAIIGHGGLIYWSADWSRIGKPLE